MNDILITVIVPVYNTAPWLRKCLESICNQTYRNLEIICVNDGSTDNSADILTEYAAKDARIRVIHQKNAGVSAARNAALRIARGDYVTGVDSDDFLKPCAYEKLLPYLTHDAELVCFGIEGIDESDERVDNSYFLLPAEGEVELTDELIVNTNAFIWNKLFRADIIKKHSITFPEGKRYEDAVFVYTAAALTKKICYVTDELYCYLIRKDSFTNGEQAKKRAFDYCDMLDILYREFLRLQLFPKKSKLFKLIFQRFYEETVPFLPSGEQKAAKKIYKAMILRHNLHRQYKGVYPFHELSRYSLIRSLFFWRKERLKVYKFLKWVILQIEETPEGKTWKWF